MYKEEYVRFLVFALASCDEDTSQLLMLHKCYPENTEWIQLHEEYNYLGKMINNYIKYVKKEWRSTK